jgi:hypothetical protein
MRHPWFTFLVIAGLAACASNSNAADCKCVGPNCTNLTDHAACQPCEPACKSSWDEKKTKKTKYSMTCEPACARAAECFCTGPAQCRCNPPCGNTYTKKKLFKQPGEEKVEKVPKYEVKMVPAGPCDCARCEGVCWWNPLSVFHYLIAH